ncbi:MAG: hypothetical protein DRG20_00955 [Deltaproteobacteria bacterium]|nr:MAG: hypothetical protein DRG20_00955 [Deltaproteobacteria bacterium]
MPTLNIIDNGNVFGIVPLLQREGVRVNVYNSNPLTRMILFKNIIKIKPIYALDKNAITLIGLRGANRHYPGFKKVIGGNKAAERLELSREDGIKLAKTLKLAIPDTHVFDSPRAAIKWLSKQKDFYVVKIDKNYSSTSTIVPKTSNEEVIKFLEGLPQNVPNIILQKKINGLEISSEAWFDSEGNVVNLNHTIEQKKLLNGNRGVITGCACTDAVWNVPRDNWERDPMTNYFLRLAPFVKKIKYVGPWDINAIITNDKQVYFLEFTPALGYSAFFAWIQTLNEDLYRALEKLFTNKPIDVLENVIGYSVRVWKTPYPLELQDERLQLKIFEKELRGQWLGYAQNLLNNRYIFLLDVYKEKDDILCAGTDGVIAEITGSTPISNPRFNAWQGHLKLFRNSSLGYRTDVGSRFLNELDRIKNLGLI